MTVEKYLQSPSYIRTNSRVEPSSHLSPMTPVRNPVAIAAWLKMWRWNAEYSPAQWYIAPATGCTKATLKAPGFLAWPEAPSPKEVCYKAVSTNSNYLHQNLYKTFAKRPWDLANPWELYTSFHIALLHRSFSLIFLIFPLLLPPPPPIRKMDWRPWCMNVCIVLSVTIYCTTNIHTRTLSHT